MQPRRWRKFVLPLGVLVMILAGAIGYYLFNLHPVQPQSQSSVRIIVEPGDTATTIARTLKAHGLIRDESIFQLYTQLTGKKASLQAGGYVLSPSQSVPQIVDHLVKGKTDTFLVTILPGYTLQDLADPKVKGSLAQQGFSSDEIKKAFGATYSHAILQGKPASASLEGYIYPETYQITASDSLETVIKLGFDEMYKAIQTNGIDTAIKKHNLTLYQAVTLASIVQKEVSNPTDQRQVAQVFLKRLEIGMMLGSDVTYMYAAKQDGKVGSPSYESPYNTRKYAGLPPGPIANFNLSALKAVATPADGNYLFFVAGDDGTTHYALTEAQHVENVKKYCTTLCS